MKGKESSKKKDMNLYRIWKSLLSIQLPLNLVQVSIKQSENESIQPKANPLFEVTPNLPRALSSAHVFLFS